MRLESTDGARVELCPVSRASSDVGDEETDWLVVRGDVRTADGRSWSFVDACLTTWEARGLAEWLRGAAAGAVPPTSGRRGAGEVRAFAEPNLALSVAAGRAEAVTVRFHFALESGPPWLADDADRVDFAVAVSTAPADLTRAAEEWERELAPYCEC